MVTLSNSFDSTSFASVQKLKQATHERQDLSVWWTRERQRFYEV